MPDDRSGLEDLYQEIILDHFKDPRNFSALKDEEVLVDEENPTCGDQVRLTAVVQNGTIADIRFDGSGCAISMASASIMTEALKGRTVEEARKMAADFIAMMRGEKEFTTAAHEDLAALEGVKRYPLRVKCATMGWHALAKALDRVKPA